jgi:hypothetical protein
VAGHCSSTIVVSPPSLFLQVVMVPSESPSALSVSWGFLLPGLHFEERPLIRSSRRIARKRCLSSCSSRLNSSCRSRSFADKWTCSERSSSSLQAAVKDADVVPPWRIERTFWTVEGPNPASFRRWSSGRFATSAKEGRRPPNSFNRFSWALFPRSSIGNGPMRCTLPSSTTYVGSYRSQDIDQ